jgi:hypothetical protein
LRHTHLVDVVVTRFLLDHQPSIVEWKLTDIHGREWVFEGKSYYVTTEYLDEESVYPQSGVLQCVLLEMSMDEGGAPLYRIDTYPEDSIDEVNIFEVRNVKPYSFI